MSFEWHTEDERNWERPEAGNENGPRRRLRWPWLLLLVAVIGSGAYFAWRQVQDRVEEGAETVRDEVRASYVLAERAARDGDQELFVSLLSGRSATWTDTQRERVDDGLLFAGTGRVFSFRPEGALVGEPAVELNPELTEAVLSVAQPFVVDAGSGLTETVVLTQTHVFRRGSQRWLLSPPDDAYWGAWQTRDGRALQVTYPQRDADIALRLQDDLERKLMEMCRTVVDCPQDYSMRMRLETDVQSIVQAGSGEQRLVGTREVTLPTPSLVGLPEDEAAYAALFRGYATHLISAAMIDVLDYECCEVALFQEALLEWQLSRLSLRSTPLTLQDYLHLIDAPLTVERLTSLMRPYDPLAADEEAPPEVHAFVDFLRNRLSMRQDPLGDMQRSLSESGSFWEWVRALTEYDSTNPTQLQDHWLAFVWDMVRATQEVAQPIPVESLPQQDIVAMCGDEVMDIYRYSLPDEQWTKEVSSGVVFAALAALPSGVGYMMSGQLPGQEPDEGLVTYLRREDEEPFAIIQEEPPKSVLLPPGLQEPQGERMVAWHYTIADESGGMPAIGLLDPASCTPEGCTLQRTAGFPIWSPDGRLALAVDVDNGGILYLPQGSTSWRSLDLQSPLFPFWLDEDSFGLVETGGGARQSLVSVDAQSGEVTQLIASDDLAEVLQVEGPDQSLAISFATKNPAQENSLLLGATRRMDGSQSYLLSLILNPERAPTNESVAGLRLLETVDGAIEDVWSYNAVQNDRFLVLPFSINSPGSFMLRFIIYDLQEEEVVLTSAFDRSDGFLMGPGQWSIDGQWYTHMVGGMIDIVAPGVKVGGKPLRRLISHDFERCESAVWVNRP